MSEKENPDISKNNKRIYNIQIPNLRTQNSNSIRVIPSNNETIQTNFDGNELQITLLIRSSGMVENRPTDPRRINVSTGNVTTRPRIKTPVRGFNHERNRSSYDVTQHSSLQHVPPLRNNRTPEDWERSFTQIRRQWLNRSRRNSFFSRLRPQTADPMRQGGEDHLSPWWVFFFSF